MFGPVWRFGARGWEGIDRFVLPVDWNHGLGHGMEGTGTPVEVYSSLVEGLVFVWRSGLRLTVDRVYNNRAFSRKEWI